jgi:uncharacterized protein
MSDARSANRANSDPSMDDILASIRRIISDDEARAQGANRQTLSQSERPTVVPPSEPTLPSSTHGGDGDDVLLLTDPIDAPASSAPASSAPQPAMPDAGPVPMSASRLEPVRATETAQPSALPPSTAQPADGALVGSGAVGAASSAFARLNQAVQESVPPPAAEESGPAVDANGKTIEDLVKEMLRPMLKEWLDRNLPPMVERFVELEIVRLTRR